MLTDHLVGRVLITRYKDYVKNTTLLFIGTGSLLNNKVTKVLYISVVSYNILANITSFKDLIGKLYTVTIGREESQIIYIVKEIEVPSLNPILSDLDLSNKVLSLEKQTLKPKGKGKVKGRLVSSSAIEGLASTKKSRSRIRAQALVLVRRRRSLYLL